MEPVQIYAGDMQVGALFAPEGPGILETPSLTVLPSSVIVSTLFISSVVIVAVIPLSNRLFPNINLTSEEKEQL